MKSPRTTIGAIITAAITLGHLAFVVKTHGWTALANETESLALLAACVSLFFARDHKTSDQEAGVRPETPAVLDGKPVRRAEPYKGIHGGRRG